MNVARMLAGFAAVVLLAAAALSLLWQVDVGDPPRACGSALDSVTDRSGWEVWWAQDLDEATSDRPSELLRTRQCPDAINRQTALAALLGVGAVIPAGFAVRVQRNADQTPLERIGLVAMVTGVALTLAGLAAVALLVADQESTLFLYTDRLVVGVVGLIALVPAAALAFGGWALRTSTRRPTSEGSDA